MRLLDVVPIPLLASLLGCPGAPPLSAEGSKEPGAETPSRPYRIVMFDVGTGLSILVGGDDFSMLYDAGSNDDRVERPQNRSVAYLEKILGASGPAACRVEPSADTAELPIDQVFLSHPHRDHLSFLGGVLGCFAVANVWDSGKSSDNDGYQGFLDAVAHEEGVTYHHAIGARGEGDERRIPRSVGFKENDSIHLGDGAIARVLSVRPDARDPNDASIVLRVDLGRVSMLFEGDAGGGPRKDPSSPPGRGSVEADLLEHHAGDIDVDILQVGHHGSMTSSRGAFLDAVSPRYALVSTGPMPYGEVTLPDPDVIRALEAHHAKVLRTDANDDGCRSRSDPPGTSKMGIDADGAPGGCSAFTLLIDASGRITVEQGPDHD